MRTQSSVADNPAVGDQAVPAGQSGAPIALGGHLMLRLQAPLPDRYTRASAEQLDEWIGAAKASLGDQLLILGHHYQRDEVIKWADARGDSFNLARFAADNHQATDRSCSAVCTSWPNRPTCSPAPINASSSPTSTPGCSMADMADIDQVEECWDALAAVTDVEQSSRSPT